MREEVDGKVVVSVLMAEEGRKYRDSRSSCEGTTARASGFITGVPVWCTFNHSNKARRLHGRQDPSYKGRDPGSPDDLTLRPQLHDPTVHAKMTRR